MPTGYTAKLHDGEAQTFAEFTLDCARAFGALILLRDSPNAEIPDEFEPRTYDAEEAERLRAELEIVEAWSLDDAAADRDAERDKMNQRIIKAREDAERQRDAYEAMLAQVEAWTPPSPDHQGLKDFMRDQLTESIRFDCADVGSYYSASLDRLAVSAQTYRQQRIDELTKRIADAEQRQIEENERTAGRNLWVRQLRESLAGVDA